VLQCVAVCCSVLQCVAVFHSACVVNRIRVPIPVNRVGQALSAFSFLQLIICTPRALLTLTATHCNTMTTTQRDALSYFQRSHTRLEPQMHVTICVRRRLYIMTQALDLTPSRTGLGCLQ